MATLQTKPTGFFKPDPKQPRKNYTEAELPLLGASMKTLGQLQPVGAKPDGTLLWGERRFRAAQLVGLKELSVIITDRPLSDSEIRLIQLAENMHRADLADAEIYLAVKELAALNPTWLKKDFAAHLHHKDASMMVRIFAVDDLIPGSEGGVSGSAFRFSKAYEISKGSEQEQQQMLDAILCGARRDEVARQGRKLRNSGGPAVKMSRIKAVLPSGVVIVVSGEGLSLDDLIESLAEAHKEAKKAREQGLDARTFSAVMRDKARKG